VTEESGFELDAYRSGLTEDTGSFGTEEAQR
jgi:hypothetical protein